MKQQVLINKVFPITFLLFPVSLLIGPMISEIIMFLIIFFLIQKIKINNKKLLLIFSLFLFLILFHLYHLNILI